MLDGLKHNIFTDDAYYYIIVARTFAHSGLFSFDGISETNGFHPLLFWLQVALFKILGPQASALKIYHTLVISSAFVLMTFIALSVYGCIILRRTPIGQPFSYAIVLAIAICSQSQNVYMIFSGMEATLAFPLFVLIIISMYLGRYTTAGIIGALLVLARLDTLPYALTIIFCLYGLYEWHKRRDWIAALRIIIKLFAPTMVVVVVYMLFTHAHFGTWLPIHGKLKSCFPSFNVQWGNLFGTSSHWSRLLRQRPFVSLMLSLTGGLLLIRPRHIGRQVRFMGLVLMVVTLSQLSSFVLFQKWVKMIPAWYQVLPLLSAATCMTVGVANVVSLRKLKMMAMLCLLSITLLNGRSLLQSRVAPVDGTLMDVGWRNETLEFIRSTPKDALWAYSDCGQFAYWGERRFINLDGLINNIDYQDRLRHQQLGAYLLENNVRYLIAGVWNQLQPTDVIAEPMYAYRHAPKAYSGDYDHLPFYMYSYLYNTYSEKVLLPKQAEIWRSPGLKDGSIQARFIVYDMKIVEEWWDAH